MKIWKILVFVALFDTNTIWVVSVFWIGSSFCDSSADSIDLWQYMYKAEIKLTSKTSCFTKILPLIGRMVSKDNSADTYLPESVNEFPDGDKFLTILADVGFINNKCYLQTLGIASIYEAHKAKN